MDILIFGVGVTVFGLVVAGLALMGVERSRIQRGDLPMH